MYSMARILISALVAMALASAALLPVPPTKPALPRSLFAQQGRLTWRVFGALPLDLEPARLGAAGDESCVIPTDFMTLLGLTDATGRRTHDLGNYDACKASGYGYCLLQIGGDGGTPVGVCLPGACERELLACGNATQCMATVAGQYILQVAPIIGILEAIYDNDLPIMATCGDGAQTSWPAGAILTVFALAALAAAVAVATIFIATRTQASKPMVTPWIAALASRISLTTTLPPVLSAAPRRRRPGSADLGAMDAVRALSTACVILGHTVYFVTSAPGFVNISAVSDAAFSAAGQVLPSAEFAVDSFFLLSGCLGAYLLAREVAKALPHWAAAAMAGSAAHGDSVQVLEWLQAGAMSVATAAATCTGPVEPRDRLIDEDDADESGWKQPLGGGTAEQVAEAPSPPWAHTTMALAGLYVSLFMHRFLRLMPTLFATMCVMYYVMPLVSAGPYWFKYAEFIEPCEGKYFWLTAFFLFNVDTDTQCTGWAWYLAVDFQLYATVLPLLTFIYSWRPAAGWFALVATMTSSLAVSVWVVVSKNLSSTLDANGQLEALGLTGDTFKYFYTQPWTRAPAFLVGVGLGFSLLSYERRLASRASACARDVELVPPSMSADTSVAAPNTPGVCEARRVDWVSMAVLAVALALLGVLWYLPANNFAGALGSTPPGGWSKEGIEFYTAASRPLWAAGLAAVLYLCATGRGGVLHAVLAHPMWAPYVRISYCAYLIHPLILFGLNFSATTEMRFSAFSVAVAYTANLVLVAVAATVMHVVVEAPLAAVEKLLADAATAALRGSRQHANDGHGKAGQL